MSRFPLTQTVRLQTREAFQVALDKLRASKQYLVTVERPLPDGTFEIWFRPLMKHERADLVRQDRQVYKGKKR